MTPEERQFRDHEFMFAVTSMIKVAAIVAAVVVAGIIVKPFNDANQLEREKYEHAQKVLDRLLAPPDLGVHVAPELHTDRPFNL